jgi:hypothetical protein
VKINEFFLPESWHKDLFLKMRKKEEDEGRSARMSPSNFRRKVLRMGKSAIIRDETCLHVTNTFALLPSSSSSC